MNAITPVILINIIISIIALLFWLAQFKRLMRMKAEEFESREDKIIWAMVLVILNLFGALLFYFIVTPIKDCVNRPKVNENICSKLKDKFPDYINEIDLLSKVSFDDFKRSENWFMNKRDDFLVKRFKLGPEKVGPIAFAVLLTVIDQRGIKINL